MFVLDFLLLLLPEVVGDSIPDSVKGLVPDHILVVFEELDHFRIRNLHIADERVEILIEKLLVGERRSGLSPILVRAALASQLKLLRSHLLQQKESVLAEFLSKLLRGFDDLGVNILAGNLQITCSQQNALGQIRRACEDQRSRRKVWKFLAYGYRFVEGLNSNRLCVRASFGLRFSFIGFGAVKIIPVLPL
ncbi:MAG: hypothetical protein U5N86_04745 [Planctomycetota bacterium]|nr:hypothetical protein [Planctomycetota bacterium]